MTWNFVLANRNGVTLSVLDTGVKSAQFEFNRSDVSKATLEFDVEDERAITLVTETTNTAPRLYAYRDSILKFAGVLTSLDQRAGAVDGSVTAGFEDGLALLRYRISRAEMEYYDAAATSIIGSSGTVSGNPSLLTQANENAATGLVAGTVSSTSITVEELTVNREVVLESVLAISRLTGGPDLRVNPQPQGATLATLDVGPIYTATDGNVNFAYGPTTQANVLEVAAQVQPPTTRVITVGNVVEGQSRANATLTTAEGALGRWEAVEQRSDLESETDCVNAADALVRAGWKATYSFTPDPANAPSPLQDYVVGDVVNLTAVRGSILVVADCRVNRIGIDVDSGGIEAGHQVDVEVGDAVLTSPASSKVPAVSLTSSKDAVSTASRLGRF